MTRILARILGNLLAASAVLAVAPPALAQDQGGPAPQQTWQGQQSWQGGWTGQAAPMPYPGAPQPAPDPHYQRMLDRCQRTGHRDNGVGGALIGGVVGGVIGNRVAEGDRTLGTVAGAAVGAVAGAAIDKAEDRAKERELDRECEEFFRTYGPPQGHYPSPAPYAPPGYPYSAYGYGYPPYGYGYGYVMVPVMIQSQPQPCVETRTVTYEDVPVRSRSIPRRAVVHDKRVREKRVYIGN